MIGGAGRLWKEAEYLVGHWMRVSEVESSGDITKSGGRKAL